MERKRKGRGKDGVNKNIVSKYILFPQQKILPQIKEPNKMSSLRRIEHDALKLIEAKNKRSPSGL